MSGKSAPTEPHTTTTNTGGSPDLGRYYIALARIADSECCCSENELPGTCPHTIALLAISSSEPTEIESVNQIPLQRQGVSACTERMAYSVEEAAQLLGVHYFSVYRLVQRGKLRACRALRGKLLIPRSELLKLLRTEEQVK